MAQKFRLQGRLPAPQKRTRAHYSKHPGVAPYIQFASRPQFYSGMVHNGVYTAEIWGCPWRCDGCWSQFGHVGSPVVFECTPEQVVHNMLGGMHNNLQGGARISGGDAGYWWAHVREVIDEFIEQTKDKRLRLTNGRTTHERLAIVVETSGGIDLRPEQLQDIERVHGENAAGVILSIGTKATNPEQLARLTGQPLAAATAAHDRQMALIRAACQLDYIRPTMTFLDRYSPQDEFTALVDEFDELRPGVARDMVRFPFKNYRR